MISVWVKPPIQEQRITDCIFSVVSRNGCMPVYQRSTILQWLVSQEVRQSFSIWWPRYRRLTGRAVMANTLGRAYSGLASLIVTNWTVTVSIHPVIRPDIIKQMKNGLSNLFKAMILECGILNKGNKTKNSFVYLQILHF